MNEPITSWSKREQRDRATAKSLLVWQIGVSCQQHVEGAFCSGQQLTIRETTPAHLLDRADFVTFQIASETPVNTLVQQDFHFVADKMKSRA